MVEAMPMVMGAVVLSFGCRKSIFDRATMYMITNIARKIMKDRLEHDTRRLFDDLIAAFRLWILAMVVDRWQLLEQR